MEIRTSADRQVMRVAARRSPRSALHWTGRFDYQVADQSGGSSHVDVGDRS